MKKKKDKIKPQPTLPFHTYVTGTTDIIFLVMNRKALNRLVAQNSQHNYGDSW